VLVAALQDKASKRSAAEALTEIGSQDKAITAALTEALKDPEGESRILAAQALLRANAKHQAAQAVLDGAFKDPKLISAAASASRKLGAATTPILIKTLKEGNHQAVSVLRWVAEEEKQEKAAAAAMIKALKDAEEGARWQTVRVLLEMGVTAPEMAPVLLAEVVWRNESGPAYRVDPVGLALADIGPAAVPAFHDALEGKPFPWGAPRPDRFGQILGQIDTSPKTIKLLLDVVKDMKKGFSLRLGCIRGLAEIGPDAKDAIPVLADILLKDDSGRGELLVEAGKALGEIGPSDKKVLNALNEALGNERTLPGGVRGLVLVGAPAIPLLADIVRKKDHPLRINSVAAANALGEIGPPAVPALIECLKDKDLGLRIVVCNALGQIGPQAKGAVPALLEVFKAGENTAALAAGAAAMRIDPEAAKKAGVK
jgi:HEAT repeat protein